MLQGSSVRYLINPVRPGGCLGVSYPPSGGGVDIYLSNGERLSLKTSELFPDMYI